MLGNSNGTVQFGTNAVLNSINATASVTGNTVNIANNGASQSVNIATDSNTGTVNIGDSTGTKKTINVVGAFNATGPSFSALSAGTMTINNSAASQSINLGTDSNVGTINVGSSNKTVNINSNALTWTNGGNLNYVCFRNEYYHDGEYDKFKLPFRRVCCFGSIQQWGKFKWTYWRHR